MQNVHHKEALAEKLAGLGFVTKGHFQGSLKGFTGSSGFRTHNTILITRQREGERERQRQRDRETEREKVSKDEGISGLPKQNNPTTLPGHVDPRTHEGKLFNSWGFSGDGSCHEETPFSPGSTSTCHARSQGNLAHSTRSRRNKRLNGTQDTTKVLRASPNPAGTESVVIT